MTQFNQKEYIDPLRLVVPGSWVGHIPFISWFLVEFRPKLLVELGTHTGNSYCAMCQSIVENNLTTKAFAVDTWQGDVHAGYYGDGIFLNLKEHHDPLYGHFSTLLRMTFDNALNVVEDNSVDLLHIDGLHTYEAVKYDFETWLPKMSRRGIILFHDTNVFERDFGVYKLWRELKEKYAGFEFTHSHGLGVLLVGADVPTSFLELNQTEKYNPNWDEFNRKFRWFGANIERRHTIDLNAEKIKILNDSFVEKDRAIDEFKKASQDFHHLAIERYDLIQVLNAQINTLTQACGGEQNATALHELLLEKQKNQLEEQKNQLEEQSNQLEKQKNQLEKQSNQLEEQKNQLETQRNQLINFRQSSSWRVTTPLRFISRQLRRIPHILRLTFPAIKLGGGILNTSKKAAKLFLREGVPGLKRGFRLVAASQVLPNMESGEVAFPPIFDRNDYAEWIKRYDTVGELDRVNMRSLQTIFEYKPLISIVVVTRNPEDKFLISAIEAIGAQIYTNWEVYVVVDERLNSSTSINLENLAVKDSRIKIEYASPDRSRESIIHATLGMLKGEWLVLLESNNLITENALFWIVSTINANHSAQLIYCDEDKIDADGKRYDPYFKCDWNSDLFYSQNMLGCMVFYRTDLVRKIGGLRDEFAASKMYDLVLRCVEAIKHEQIIHIPRVLHHANTGRHLGQMNEAAFSKLTATMHVDENGVKALQEHFARLNIKAQVSIIKENYRVKYVLPEILPLVTLIIPTRNGLSLLRQCIDSIINKTTYGNYDLLIVDNGSDEPETLEYLRVLAQNPRHTILRDDGPFNYSALNNKAVKCAKGNIVALINNDIEVISKEWLSEMVSHALRPGVGAVGARLWFSDDTLQHAGVVLGCYGLAGHAHKNLPKNESGYFNRANLVQGYSAVTAACLVIQKDIFLEVGGLNEEHLRVAFNDVDLCAKLIKAGYRNIWTPYADLYHHESATRGPDDANQATRSRMAKEASYIQRQWSSLLAKDPAYNPNLTLEADDFSLAWPPRLEALSVPKSTDMALRKHYLFLTYRMILGWGVDVAVANMAQHMIAMGYKVTIACLDKDDSYDHLNVMLVQNDPQSIDHLIEQLGCDCVVAHTSPFFEILPRLKSKISTWAMEYGDPTPELFKHDFLERKSIKQNKILNCYPLVNGVIGISKFIRSDIEWSTAKIVYMGCDHAPDLGLKGIFDLDQTPLRPLKVGTLMRLGKGESNYKGNQLFLDLVAKYKSKNSAVKFFVMGRGTPEDAQFFKSMGIEVFLNASDDEKWSYLRDLDVFLSPSQWEGFNLPLVEAQALGTIGLAFDTGAHPEVTPHIVSSVDEAAELIQILAQNKFLLLEESALAYRFVRNQFSWKKSAVDLLQITSGH